MGSDVVGRDLFGSSLFSFSLIYDSLQVLLSSFRKRFFSMFGIAETGRKHINIP